MKYLLPTELAQMLTTAIKTLEEAKKIVIQCDQQALANAAQGVTPNEANAIGVEGYKRAGQLAFQAIQTIMYSQSATDLKDATTTCANTFNSGASGLGTNIANDGFAYPRFAVTKCPRTFKKYAGGAIQLKPADELDANLPNSASSATYLILWAIANEMESTRQNVTVPSGAGAAFANLTTPNPFEAIEGADFDTKWFQIFKIDLDNESGGTSTPDNDVLRNLLGQYVSGPSDLNFFETQVDNTGGAGKTLKMTDGTIGWRGGEHFFLLALDPGGGSTSIKVSGANQPTADFVVETGSNLLIRLVGDSMNDISSSITGYNPSA